MNNKRYLPTAASFLISEDCNLACTYCFELKGRRARHMSKEVARKGVKFLCDNALKNGDKEFSVMFFGGEPLLNPKVVEEVFKYGLELAEKYNLNFSTSMVTNATILTEDIKRIIRTYKDRANLFIQLSVDGIREIHNKYRITKGTGIGSFDMVEKNIPEWKKLFADNMNRLSVHGCSNHDTLPCLFENYLFFREEWDIPRIWFMPIHSETWDEKDLEIYEEQLNKITDYILDRCRKEGNYQEVINYAPIDRCLSPDRFPEAPCGAGKNFITITAEGEFYPCHQIYFNDPEKITKIGTLDTGIDELKRSLFLHYDNNDLSCAKLDPECDAYHCYRCVGENWEQNGSILSTVACGGIRCKMSKIERSIQLKIKEELNKMGLLNNNNQQSAQQGNNPNNPDCLCDSRNASGTSENQQVCKCGNEYEGTENEETIALALKTILNKLDTLEKGQEFILKKLLK